MAGTVDPAASPLVRKLESVFRLSEDEKAALLNLPLEAVEFRADQDIVREGDRPDRSFLLLEGFAFAYKATREGKRQTLAFYVPGDIPDLQSLHLDILDNSVGTLTPCKVGFIKHESLQDLCRRYPRLASAFWRETLIDASIYREWLLNVGRRPANARMAHVLCELLVRLEVVGLAHDRTCDLPITQAEFADALGLSTVHVNRVLQEIRAAGLIELRGNTLRALNWEELKRLGDFDPTYLHLMREEAG